MLGAAKFMRRRSDGYVICRCSSIGLFFTCHVGACGVSNAVARLERLAWLGRYQRVTDRLAQACSQLLQSSNVQAVARFFDLGWHTVKTLDKARLRESVCEPDWTRIEYLAMDEFALHKGHRYATVLVDPIGRQVLWIGPGRSRETAQAFFEQLPPGVAQRIKAVAIDMTTAYELEIRDHCPQAEIVYDLFHVVAKYGSVSIFVFKALNAWPRIGQAC